MPLKLSNLGSASAVPSKDTYFTAHVLNVRGRLCLLDCGEGTQFRLRQLGFSLGAVDYLFLTHLHGDHCFGIFGLLSTMNLLERHKPLHITAPAACSDLLQYYTRYHCRGEQSYEVIFHPLQAEVPEPVLDTSEFSVTALPLHHTVPTYGYLFEERKVRKSLPRRVAYCTDTAPFPDLARWVQGVDLLFHDSTFLECDTEKAQKYLHSTPVQAACLAREAQVKQLLLGHFSQKYNDVWEFLSQAQAVFPRTSLSLEGTEFEVPRTLCE